jgi:hypothetical protein
MAKRILTKENQDKLKLIKAKLTKADGETIDWDALGIIIFDLIEKVEKLEKKIGK